MDKKKTESVFIRFIDFILGTDEESKKKRILKRAARHMEKNGYPYFRYHKGMLTTNYAYFLYNVYHAVDGPRTAFSQIKTPTKLAYLIISFSLPPNIRALVESLDVQTILDAGEKNDYKEIYQQVKSTVDALRAYFTPEQKEHLIQIYNAIMLYKQFCMFDYYALLRKFGTVLKENDFSAEPVFTETIGRGCIDDITDFVSAAIPFIQSDMLDVQLAFAGKLPGKVDVMRTQLEEIRKILKEQEKYKVLENLCCILHGDPEYHIPLYNPKPDTVLQILNDIVVQANQAMHEVYQQQKNRRIENAASKLFPSEPEQILKYYTERFGSSLSSLQAGNFFYTEAMNYLAAFLNSSSITDLKLVTVALSIKAETTNQSILTGLFEIFHSIEDIQHQIAGLDLKISPNNKAGCFFANLLQHKVLSEKERTDAVHIIGQLNKEAHDILFSVDSLLLQMTDILNSLADDSEKSESEIVTNWLEVNHDLPKPANSILRNSAEKMELMDNLIKAYSVLES